MPNWFSALNSPAAGICNLNPVAEAPFLLICSIAAKRDGLALLHPRRRLIKRREVIGANNAQRFQFAKLRYAEDTILCRTIRLHQPRNARCRKGVSVSFSNRSRVPVTAATCKRECVAALLSPARAAGLARSRSAIGPVRGTLSLSAPGHRPCRLHVGSPRSGRPDARRTPGSKYPPIRGGATPACQLVPPPRAPPHPIDRRGSAWGRPRKTPPNPVRQR